MGANGIFFSASWSPNGNQIVFSSARALNGTDAVNPNGVSNLWVMNADGTAPVALTRQTASEVQSIGTQWSPNGSKIAFFSSRAVDGTDALGQANNVWIMNSDGSGATPFTRLTVANADSFDAIWSPDGSQLAFTSSRALDGSNATSTNRTPNIWLINSDGTNAMPLTRLTAADSHVLGWRP
jgi:Tol biopolymer transport system component